MLNSASKNKSDKDIQQWVVLNKMFCVKSEEIWVMDYMLSFRNLNVKEITKIINTIKDGEKVAYFEFNE